MGANGILQKHWVRVTWYFVLDAVFFILAFVLGTWLRLGPDYGKHIAEYTTGILWGAVIFSCVSYICGLYTPQSRPQGTFKRAIVLALCLLFAIGCMVAMFYINFSSRIGRGVMLISGLLSYLLIFLHHTVLLHQLRNFRERVALIVTSPLDEAEARLLEAFPSQNLEMAGLIHDDGFQPAGTGRILGRVKDLAEIVRREDLGRVLCTNRSMLDVSMYRQFCQLRYSGVPVMPMIHLCEEVYQCVPLELVTPEWLLGASGAPHILYIRKIKRAFDIVCSLVGLVLLGPFMLAGMALVKLTSPGPVFYRQTRCSRFGRPFKVIKLRTMAVDAEKDGPVWSQRDDPRVSGVGRILRKYRIDEIPQLINVLRGEMSFVGPRPERPEFSEELSAQIPFYRERMMVQPGVTGWAQVNYPYGSNVEDARRKLEYDLYYMKNMSLFLDLFILLDTVRIVLHGGLDAAPPRVETRAGTVRDWETFRTASRIKKVPVAETDSH